MESNSKIALDAEQKAFMAGQAALDKKAENVQVLDVRGISSFSDFFVICSGHSTRHVQGIVRAIEDVMDLQKIHPRGIEGLEQAQWVLMDYNDVVIHVFYNPVREFYGLESLWSEAKIVVLEDKN